MSIERALPAVAYHRPEYYALEVDRIFRREWLLVASTQQIPLSGDYVSLDLVGEPVVVVRGHDGQVRCLSTVCRHRYALVVEPDSRGNADQFTCPFHAWRYDLAGRLTAAPLMGDVDGFCRDGHGLPSFAVEEWEGLVFVNLAADPDPLAPRLAPIATALARYGMSTARQVAFDDPVWIGNWKGLIDNISECYHHKGTHADLDAMLPARGTYGGPGGEGWAVHFTPVAPGADWGVDLDAADSGLTAVDLDEMAIYNIFPSAVVLNVGPLIGWFSILPQGVGRSRFVNGFLAPASLADAGAVDNSEVVALMNQINDQDERIMELVQRGVSSAYARPGVLSHREPVLPEFHAYLRRMLTDAAGRPPY